MSKSIYSVVELYDERTNKWTPANLWERGRDGKYFPAQLASGASETIGYIWGEDSLDYALDKDGEPDELKEALIEGVESFLSDRKISSGIPRDAGSRTRLYYQRFVSEFGGNTYHPGSITFTAQDLILLRYYAREISHIALMKYEKYFEPLLWALRITQRSAYCFRDDHARIILWWI